MNKLGIAIVIVAAATLAGCGNPYPRSDLAYLDHGSGTYIVDQSPYNGNYWDRYYYGPRY